MQTTAATLGGEPMSNAMQEIPAHVEMDMFQPKLTFIPIPLRGPPSRRLRQILPTRPTTLASATSACNRNSGTRSAWAEGCEA